MRTHRPSPALVVAVAALVVALCGSTVAGYAAVKASGDSIIKKKSLSGNRLKNDTVNGTKIAEASLGKVPSATTADRATPPALRPLTLGAGWAKDPGLTTRTPGYRVDASGFVHLQGALTGTSGSAAVMARFPDALAPAPFTMVPAVTEAGTGIIVIGGSGGSLELSAGDEGYVSLEGISWYPGK